MRWRHWESHRHGNSVVTKEIAGGILDGTSLSKAISVEVATILMISLSTLTASLSILPIPLATILSLILAFSSGILGVDQGHLSVSGLEEVFRHGSSAFDVFAVEFPPSQRFVRRLSLAKGDESEAAVLVVVVLPQDYDRLDESEAPEELLHHLLGSPVRDSADEHLLGIGGELLLHRVRMGNSLLQI